MRLTLVFLFLTAFFQQGFSQDFSNKGKDFWIGYGNHVRMFNAGGAEKMQIYITSDVNTTATVSIPSIGFNQTNIAINANQITTIDIPRSAALLDEGLYNHGIHVTALKPVVVYSFIYVNAISGATLCLPTATLGREYYSINYTQVSNEANSYSYFFAVAVDTGTTTLEITPSQFTKSGKAPNIPFTVNLTQGQIYQVLSATDLTGSLIKSKSTGTGCKKIAVFCGSGKINIGAVGGNNSSDNLYQQMYPTSTWGKKYVTAPSINTANPNGQYNYYRIFKADPDAMVKVNGGLIPPGAFVNNQYASLAATNEPSVIESDKQIMVAQYFPTQGTSGNGGLGDPEMVYLNPVEQTINKVTLNSMQPVTGTNINQHFVNIIIKNSPAAINTFKIDGVAYPTSFQTHPYAPDYAYARIQVTNVPHTLTCDTAFNAISYGFGANESYGYSGGTNLKDLYQFVSIQNDYGTVNFPAGCKGSPFKFSMTFPYQPTQIKWIFGPALNAFGLNDTTIVPLTYDSTWVVDGKSLYKYKLNRTYAIPQVGSYPILIQANNPTTDGCSGLQEIDYELQIFDQPVADFNFTHTGCVSDPVQFIDNTNGQGRTVIKYYWDFGDGNFSAVPSPSHQYLVAGAKTVRHAALTDVGCLSDTLSKPIPLSDPPIAKFAVTAPFCEKLQIEFKDESTVPLGTIVKWTWNFGEGTPVVALTGATQYHTYNTPGTYNVTLQVETSTGCRSVVFSKPILISPKPVVDFQLPGNVCLPSGAAQFTDLTSIADASALTYAWQFGDGGTSTNKSPLYNYAATGPFQVKLTVTSAMGCVDDSVKTLSTIYAQPKANFLVSAEVCLNDSTRFTDASDGKGSIVQQWYWSFGDGNTSSLQNPAHKYLTANTFVSQFYIVTDKGCHSDTVNKPTVVNPLPVANYNFSAPTCETKTVTFTDASVPGVGSLNKWTWDFGSGTTYSTPGPTHTFAAAGDYPVTLVVENSKGCISPLVSKNVHVNYQPQVEFGTPEVCLSDPFAEFTDSSKINDNSEAQFTWAWNFGDPNAAPGTNTDTRKNPRHRYTATGVYNVTLTVTSKDGCVSTLTKPFTVNGSIPVAGFNVNNPTELCSNTEMSIKDASTVDFGTVVKVEIYWDYGNDPTNKTVDETPTAGKTYAHSYPEFGTPATKTYTIRYVAYSGINCINQITKQVVIKASPSIQFDPMADICQEQAPYIITAAREIYNLAGTGTFSGPGILTAAGQFSPAAATPGTHTIRYSFAAANGCSTFADQTITVDPTPTADAGPDKFVLEGGFISLTGKGTGNAVSYLWTPNSYVDNNRISTPRVSPPDDITYTLTVTSADGCVDRDQVFVKVLKAPKVPNAFSPNGDGINDRWIIEYLDTYPGATVDVYNRYGQLVYHSVGYNTPWDGTVNGKPLPVATYYWIINPKNGRAQMNGSVTILR